MIKPKFYKQADSKWDGYSWRGATVARNGCGPSSIANSIAVLDKLKHTKVTPLSAFKWLCKHGYMHPTYGTYYSGISALLKAYGVKKVIHTSNFRTVKKHLKKGDHCICLCGKSRWTSSGHYITAYGMSGDNVLISDSASSAANRAKAPFSVLKAAIKAHPYPQVWIIDNTAQYISTKEETKTTTKSKPKNSTGKKSMKGFDISYVQNGLTLSDFKKAKKAGWEFVIIRLGTRLNGKLYTDNEFESKYKNAKEAGLKIGIYFYSLATSTDAAKTEAKYVLKVLKNRALQYPIFIDFEDPKAQSNLGMKKSKQICEAFCKVIEDAGYDAGVYSFYNWLVNKISPISDKYYVWLAQYNNKDTYSGRHEMWQYSSTASVPGIGKPIDVNVSSIPFGSYPVKSKKKADKEKTKKKVTYPTLPKRGYFTMKDKGVNVKRLQTLLVSIGYKLKIDGMYGDKTASVVRSFQKDKDLTVDGVFGKKSLDALTKATK